MANSTLTTPDSRPLRIALIGAGRHAQHHARAILRCPGVQLVAVADPSDAAQAAMRDIVPGIGCFKTPEELFASERLNVVHIITPPATHAPLARMAIKAGCHIYVEKPFTESVEDAQQILDEALCVETDFKPLEQEVGDIVAAAVKFADESPFPEPSALHRDVMVED